MTFCSETLEYQEDIPMVTTEVLDINISEVIALELGVVEDCMTSVETTGRVAMSHVW